MARLPTPGGDNGNWGDILNDYLSQTLQSDGTLKDNVVTGGKIAPNAITSAKIASDAIGTAQIADGSVSEALLDEDVKTKLNQSAPTWSTLQGKPSHIAAGNSQVAARTSIAAASKQSFLVDDYGADPTGATASDTAIAAAIQDLGGNPGIIEFGVGHYRLESTKTLSRPGQYFKGQAVNLTVLDYRGTGPCLYSWDSLVNPNGLEAPGRGGGILGGMSIVGDSNTNNGSIGYKIGDLVNPIVENLYISGFTRQDCIGFLGSNSYSWTEYGKFHVRSDFNTNCFIIEANIDTHPFSPVTSNKTSWSYNVFNFNFSAEANQNGVILRNHVSLIGINWNMNFNCNPGNTNNAVAVTVGISSTDDCHVEGMLSWVGEATNPGTVSHKDINVGANSSLRGHGSLIFHDYTNVPWQAGSAVPYRVVFAGRVNCPSLGHYADAEVPFVTIGDPGRFGALGDDANYIDIIEGDNGNWPALNMRGPSSDIGFLINTKGYGELQYNYQPVAITRGSTPTAWNSPGVWRQMVCDGDFLYVCISENVWKKIPLQNM